MFTHEARKDCFAYDKERNNCKALNDLYCRREKCKFYKPIKTKEVRTYESKQP